MTFNIQGAPVIDALKTAGEATDERGGSRLLLGAHMSIAGGMPKAVERARDVGATALQIFVKNATQWRGRELTPEEVAEFRSRLRESAIRAQVAHSSYLINLASADPEIRRKSRAALVDEWSRCAVLGLDWLILHPGSHGGDGEQTGLQRVAEGILAAADETGGRLVPLALEITSGQGHSLGYSLNQLRDLVAALDGRLSVGVCLDSCHLYAAGYDLGSDEGRDALAAEFAEKIGWERLAVWHVNDSKRSCGSRVDRHEHIGRGQIGVEAFRWIMRKPEWWGVPKIIETPKGDDGTADRDNLALLRELALEEGK
ncbi:MAG: deoxyribonuclease IV [Acidobacteriota bacterium]